MADGLEDLADIQSHLRRRLHEQQTVLHGVLLGLFARNLAVFLQIALVSSKSNHNIRIAASLQLLHPGLSTVEGLLTITSVSRTLLGS